VRTGKPEVAQSAVRGPGAANPTEIKSPVTGCDGAWSRAYPAPRASTGAARPGGEDGGGGGDGTGPAGTVASAQRAATAVSRGTPRAEEGSCAGGLEERCGNTGGRSAIAGGDGCQVWREEREERRKPS
jgi:hypothetical protein